MKYWIYTIKTILGTWLCKYGIHWWDYVVVDGMSFRQCGRCGTFKEEKDG